MILAPEGFRDEEYLEPKGILQGIAEIVTASSRTGDLKGMLGGTAAAEATLDEVKVEDFDAVVFVGGIGAKVYFSDSRALMIAKKAYEQGKIVAAICISPTILANAELDAKFLEEAGNNNLTTLKGHRSVGGMRASIYNAMPAEGVDALIAFMADFEQRYG